MYIWVYIQVYMNYISTTELRTKSVDLVEALLAGKSIDLIHRSKVVGAIVPKIITTNKPIDPLKFAKTLKKLEPNKKVSYRQLMKNYEHYMMYRHGPNISWF